MHPAVPVECLVIRDWVIGSTLVVGDYGLGFRVYCHICWFVLEGGGDMCHEREFDVQKGLCEIAIWGRG